MRLQVRVPGSEDISGQALGLAEAAEHPDVGGPRSGPATQAGQVTHIVSFLFSLVLVLRFLFIVVIRLMVLGIVIAVMESSSLLLLL